MSKSSPKAKTRRRRLPKPRALSEYLGQAMAKDLREAVEAVLRDNAEDPVVAYALVAVRRSGDVVTPVDRGPLRALELLGAIHVLADSAHAACYENV